MRHHIRWAIAPIWLLLLGTSACTAAVGDVSNFTCKPSTRIVKGDFDYGYEAKLTVKNTGGRGDLAVRITLSSSEGEWQRKQTLLFDAGAAMDLSYFFEEPTINVESVQCRYAIGPF